MYSPHPHHKTFIILQNSFSICSHHLHIIHTHNQYPHHLHSHTHAFPIPHQHSETLCIFPSYTLFNNPTQILLISILQIIMHFSILRYHTCSLYLPAPTNRHISHFLQHHTHTNTLTLSLPPFTYLLPSHYTFLIPPTIYILLLLLKMPHLHFHTHDDPSVSLSLCPFPLLSLPSHSLTQPYTCTCTILIFHSMKYTLSIATIITYILTLSFHYHLHCSCLHFQSDFLPSSTITHTVPIVTIITHTLLTSPPLCHCHSILSRSLHQTYSPDHLQFYTWYPSSATPSHFLPSLSASLDSHSFPICG